MEFVAIGDQDQRIAAVATPGEGDQAHGEADYPRVALLPQPDVPKCKIWLESVA